LDSSKSIYVHANEVNPITIYKPGWWFGTGILFFHILGMIIPTDELYHFYSFFRGIGQPPTRNHSKLGVYDWLIG